MPKLQTYTAKGQDLPTGFVQASGEELGGNIGTSLRRAGADVQQLHERIGEDESRQAITGAAQIRTKYAALLDQANLTGEDTTNLKSKMNDELSAVGENFQTTRGQQALNLHTATTNMVFDEQANRMAVQKAGAQAVLQGQQLLASDSGMLRTNPGYLTMAEQNVDALLETYKGRLPPDKLAEVGQKMKAELNMSAVNAAARQDPPGTKKRLEGGEWNLTPQQREQGINEADTQQRAIRADELHRRQLEDYDLRKADAAASDKLVKKIFDGSLGRTEIRLDPDLTRESRENLVRFQSWYSSDNANKPHPANLMNLWLAVHAPDDDPRKIYNGDAVFRAAETGLLNPGEAEKALGWVADQKDANNVKFMQKLNGRVMSIKAGMTADPKWAAQGELSAAVQMEVVNRATQRANELRRTGERGEDPNQIFNPNSKEYMFQPEMLNTIANDIRASVRRTPQFPDPNDPVLKALPAGSNFLDANGVMRVVPQRAPGPQKATVMDIAAGYVTPVPRAGGFTIDAPQRSSVHALNGKRYATREEAMAAIQQHYDTIK